MPNRYLGRDLANQRYLGRDVSSIRSFGRIIHPNAAIIGVYINTPTLTPNIGDNFTLTANPVPIDANSPLPFTYQWFRNGVVTGTGTTSITNSGSVAVTFTYRVEVTDGDGTVFVSPDIIIAVQAHIPILATLTYGTGISAVATGGTGTLLYAWTFAVDGIRFRLDNIQNAIDSDLSYLPPLARTNAERMNLSSIGIDVRNYFPGHTVSNVGLTMSDDNHDEFFPITDFSSFTTSNLTHQVYLGNWRNADFTSDTTSVFPFGGSIQTTGGISGGETPPGIIVDNIAIADTNTLFAKDLSYAGSESEFGAYPIDGIDNSITVENDNARLHTIVYNGGGSAVLNSLAQFELSVTAISVNPRGSVINVAIRQT